MRELAELLPQAIEFLQSGFLDESMRNRYRVLLEERSKRLGLMTVA